MKKSSIAACNLAIHQQADLFKYAITLLLFCGPANYSLADVTTLEPLIVEEAPEPETPLPLGIGLSGKTLRTTPGSAGDPVRALQALPGLNYASDEEALPAVRGSRPEDNYFLADFAPVNYLFHVDGIISVFNADLVKSFNIYQSAYGPEYSGVTGGVFDIELRAPRTDRYQTTLDVSLLHAGALIEGPINANQSFYLAGRFSYLDLFLADQIPEEDGINIEQFPKYTDYQGKYVNSFSSTDTLTFQFNGASDTQSILIDEDSTEIDTDPIFAGIVSNQSSFHEQALVWDSNRSDTVKIKSLVSHGYSNETGAFGGAGNIDIQVENWLLKSRANIDLNTNHTLTIGGEIIHADAHVDIAFSLPPCSEFDPDCVITGNERLMSTESPVLNNLHFYAKDSWSVSDRLSLYPGVAYRRESRFDEDVIEPRLALEYSLTDQTLLSAGLGLYRQAPGFVESNSVFGNPDIKHTDAVHGLLGVQHQMAGGWNVKSEIYYKKLKNLVTSDEDLRFTNEGTGTAYGIDALIKRDFGSKLSGWLALSFSNARRKDTRTGNSFAFDYDQPFNVSLVGNYKINDKWTFGAKLWAHSGSPYTPVIGSIPDEDVPGFFTPVYGPVNSERLPSYQRLDLRVDRTFQQKNDRTLSAYFELLNVLGRENANGFEYNADYSEKKITPQLSGIFSFGLKATF